jgi:hypothetical protein
MNNSVSQEVDWLSANFGMVSAACFFLAVCYAKGESPRWRRGS